MFRWVIGAVLAMALVVGGQSPVEAGGAKGKPGSAKVVAGKKGGKKKGGKKKGGPKKGGKKKGGKKGKKK